MFYQFRKNSEAITVNIFVLAKITFKTQIRVRKCRWRPTSRWAWQWTLSIPLLSTDSTNWYHGAPQTRPRSQNIHWYQALVPWCQEDSHWPRLTRILPSFILQLAVHWCLTLMHSITACWCSYISYISPKPVSSPLTLCEDSETLNENQPQWSRHWDHECVKSL